MALRRAVCYLPVYLVWPFTSHRSSAFYLRDWLLTNFISAYRPTHQLAFLQCTEVLEWIDKTCIHYLELSNVVKSQGKPCFFGHCLFYSIPLLPSGYDEKHSTFAVFTLAGAEPIKSSATWAAIFLGWLSPVYLAPCTSQLSSCYSALNMISVELTFSDLLVFDPRPTLVSSLFHFPPNRYIYKAVVHAPESIRRRLAVAGLRSLFFQLSKTRVQYHVRLLPPATSAFCTESTTYNSISSATIHPRPFSILSPALFTLMQAHHLIWKAIATSPPLPIIYNLRNTTLPKYLSDLMFTFHSLTFSKESPVSFNSYRIQSTQLFNPSF